MKDPSLQYFIIFSSSFFIPFLFRLSAHLRSASIMDNIWVPIYIYECIIYVYVVCIVLPVSLSFFLSLSHKFKYEE